MQRRLAGLVIVDGTDDEIFNDEHVHSEFPVDLVLTQGQPAAALQLQPVRWGGECRVEIDLLAKVIDDGPVQVEGHARLYEGISEDTDDLEDTKAVNFIVPKGGKPAHHGIRLESTGAGGGDNAYIKIALTNSLIENE